MPKRTTTLAQDRALLESVGIHFPSTVRAYTDDAAFARDAAQPGLLTAPNAGIPAWLANFIDPTFIEVLVQPMNATMIAQERGLGTWTTATAQFPVIEYAGEVSSYGDYNNNGQNSANINWVPRQQYVYQGIVQYGDREVEMNALAKVDYANSARNAKALAFNKFQNKSYFFGISGLQNYGLLNDPSLLPAIAPTTKTAGGTTWFAGTALEIYQDVENLYNQLQSQMVGLVTLETEMVMVIPPQVEMNLTKATQFNVQVKHLIKEGFPNLRIVLAPEYATAAGNLVQLIVPSVLGQETLVPAYGDKMRAFPIFRDLSSFRQKFSAGTWGTVIKQPFAIAQMLGV